MYISFDPTSDKIYYLGKTSVPSWSIKLSYIFIGPTYEGNVLNCPTTMSIFLGYLFNVSTNYASISLGINAAVGWIFELRCGFFWFDCSVLLIWLMIEVCEFCGLKGTLLFDIVAFEGVLLLLFDTAFEYCDWLAMDWLLLPIFTTSGGWYGPCWVITWGTGGFSFYTNT